MTDYKYRVYDGATGNEFGDVRRLQTALLLVDTYRENYPQVTIDEIVPEAPVRELQVGDRVRVTTDSPSGRLNPGDYGTLLGIDPDDETLPYRVTLDPDDDYGWWVKGVELV